MAVAQKPRCVGPASLGARVASRRPRERGAAVFVVVLVITLLTTIGIFAARNASQLNVASGHARQATQAMYFTEMALELGVAQIDGPQAGAYVNLTYASQDAANDECMVNRDAAAWGACYRVFDDEILSRVTEESGKTALVEPQSGTSFGSFGPALLEDDASDDASHINTGREGVFVIEFTDPNANISPPGYNVDDPVFHAVTLNVTGIAQIRTVPNDFTAGEDLRWCGNDVSARTATLMAVRSYVTVVVPR